MKQVNSISEMNALIKQHDMLLIYFGSNTCSVCRDIMPKIDTMIAGYPLIKAIKVDVQK